MKRVSMALVVVGLALCASPILAADATSPPVVTAPTTVSADTAMTDGEVRKVDKDAAKLTIKHGPLANLRMPGMTMVFRVREPAMLEQVKPGDMVKFRADKVDGAFTVMEIEVVK